MDRLDRRSFREVSEIVTHEAREPEAVFARPDVPLWGRILDQTAAQSSSTRFDYIAGKSDMPEQLAPLAQARIAERLG